MKAYGVNWHGLSAIEIELELIRAGGVYRDGNRSCGHGLFFHYKQLQSLLAPWKKWDRWSELILNNLIENRLTVLTGPANSTKTSSVAFFALCRYIVWPTNQCVLISSTDSRSLELRIWGEIKKFWSAARNVYEDCPGRIVESKQMIVSDVDEDEATDFRNGIIGVPTISGGTFVGLGKFVGIKNGQVFLAADEAQFMSSAFYDGISNLSNNPQFQCAAMGNPKDRTDVLGKLAEPAASIGGWEGYEPTGKTFVYPTRFPGGKVVCLDGRDTPNNDRKPGEAPPYPYIITTESIAQAVEYYGEDSIQVSMMFYGIFPPDAQAKRVVTRSLVDRFRASEDLTWTHDPLTKIFAIDAAYGSIGGDRCVGVEMHFGKCSDGMQRIAFAGVPVVIPVTVRNTMLPEDQIVTWVKDYCEAPTRNIPPSHVAFDSTGRGSLASAFGRVWTDANGTPIGTQVVAIEFGGLASDRMVSQKHQVPCRSYYLNFMSELWYDFRHLIESDQCRKLPINVMEEMCMRGWEMTKGNRFQVEAKDKCKLRMGKSPDLADAAVTGLELAKRLGFRVIGTIGLKKSNTPNWLKDLMTKQQQLQKSKQLTYK